MMHPQPSPKSLLPESLVELSRNDERILLSFETAWSRHETPRIEDYWPGTSAEPTLALLEELVRVDMEFRSGLGERVVAENYFQRFPQLLENPSSRDRIKLEESRLAAARGKASPPPIKISDHFLGFEILREIGRGTFGRVFLARQNDLARRQVVLKITRGRSIEAQVLAQLQHSNIVPIYSWHQKDGWQAICMPFLGVTTVADIINFIEHPAGPAEQSAEHRNSVRDFISTISQRKLETLDLAPQAESPQPLASPLAGDAERDSDQVSRWNHSSHAFFTMVADFWKQLAEALSFAHQQGIYHGDIKPANILVSDLGVPMLLDFNLATESAGNEGVIGGTIPYASAEQIEQIIARVPQRCNDSSWDLYSLGAVIYQLLSGKPPFPNHYGPIEQVAERYIADRRRGPAAIRTLNPAVPVDLASIVDKSLAGDPQARYASPTDLREDLDRYLKFLPLAHAPNRSLVTRANNWRKRHPVLASTASLVLISAILILSILTALWTSWQRNARFELIHQAEDWTKEIAFFRRRLSAIDVPPTSVSQGIDHLQTVLERKPAWPTAQIPLDARDQEVKTAWDQAQRQAALGHLTIAGSLLRQARALAASTDRTQLLDRIEEQHRRAVDAYPTLDQSSGYLLQRAEVFRLRGNTQESDHLQKRAEQSLGSTSYDQVIIAYELLADGNVNQATKILEQAVETNSLDFEAWLLLGNARTAAGRWADAESCYTICIGLANDSETAWYNRGRVRLDQGNYAQAVQDFQQAIRLNAAEPAYHANRGIALMALGQWLEARDAFTAAIGCPGAESRVYYLRHQVHLALNDQVAAASDLDAFLEATPATAEDWTVRGIAYLHRGDRSKALEQFRQAVQVDPQAKAAWQNQAVLLADDPATFDQALDAMSEVVKLEPNSAYTIANRGVLHARAGNCESAHSDGKQALTHDRSADTLYRVACIYSLTSRTTPEDRDQALNYLGLAFLENPRMVIKYLDEDPDLVPLASDPRFEDFKQAAKKLQQFEH